MTVFDDFTTTAPTFPVNASLFEVWEFHGTTPVRKISLGVSERGYGTPTAAQADADRLTADPDWTRGKTDPSFRVVTVSTSRTLTPSHPSTPRSTA